MNATQHRVQLIFAVALLTMISSALALLALPGSASAQTRVPPASSRLTPLRATPVTPQMPCVHLTTDGAPGSSFVGGRVKERCFAFPGDEGDVVSITLHAAGAIPAMALQGPDGAVVARSNSGRIDNQMLDADGPYAIIVSGANMPKTIRIEASVTAQGSTLGPEQPHPSEQGTAMGQAPLCTGVLSFSQPQTGMVPFPGESCSFTFNARRGQSVYAWMESLSDGLQPELTLLDPNGEVLSSDHVVDSRTRYASAFNLPASGVYTVVAGSQGGQSAGAFKLTLKEGASAFCDDVLEPGVLTEVALPTGGRQCALYVDVPSSRRLRFELLPLDDAAAPSWVVADASGEVLASNDDPLAIWTAEETGRYAVTLSPTSRQRARILVQMAPMMPSPPIYYISPSCGGALTAGEGSGSRPEVMTLAGNVCDYTFSGARGETIWVAASKDNASSPFQPVLVLMKPGFAAVDPPEATGDNTVFSGMAVIRNHILAQTGRYTVRVSDYGDDDTGSFFIMLWKR